MNANLKYMFFHSRFTIDSLFGCIGPSRPSQADECHADTQNDAQYIFLSQYRVAGSVGILRHGRVAKVGGIGYNDGTTQQTSLITGQLRYTHHNGHDERNGNEGIVGTTTRKEGEQETDRDQAGDEQEETTNHNRSQPTLTDCITFRFIGLFNPSLCKPATNERRNRPTKP